MKLLIKNMVSIRCKMIVKSELQNMGLHVKVVELGEVEIFEELNKKKIQAVAVSPSKLRVGTDGRQEKRVD